MLVYEAAAGVTGLMSEILLRDYSTSTVLKVIEEKNLESEIVSSIKAGPAGFDMWVLHTKGMGDIVAARDGYYGSEAQTKGFLSNGGKWLNMHPAAAALFTYNSSVVGLPIGYKLPYLYYRMDFFQEHDLAVPSTWEEMAEIVELFNGTDIDGDGEPDRSLCLDSSTHHILLEHVLGTMTQIRGMSSGILFDPATMQPLVNNPAMENALKIVARLLPNTDSYDEAESYDGPFVSKFNQGKCIMAIDVATVFKAWDPSSSPVKAEHFGITLPPGSQEVLDRTSMQLVPCTRSLCSDYDRIQDMYFNRAPTPGLGGSGISTNPSLPEAYQGIVTAAMSRGLSSLGGAVNRNIPASPVDNSLLDTSKKGMQPWLAAGYDPDIALTFVTVSRRILDHPNLGMELRIPLRESYMEVLRKVVYAPGFANLSSGSNSVRSRHLEQSFSEYGAVMKQMEDEFNKILHEDTIDFDVTSLVYRTFLGWTARFQAGAGQDSISQPRNISNIVSADSSDSSFTTTIIVAIVAPVFSVTIIFVVAAYMCKMRKSKKHDWRGVIMAPLPGPDTTLIITDIEGSTTLWEQLPAEIMNSVIKMHHGVMRAHLLSCCGYESATEGDSFLIAFHNPTDAVKFSIHVQEDMLTAPWPQELLDLPLCAAQSMMEIPLLKYLLNDIPRPLLTSTPRPLQLRIPTSCSITLEPESPCNLSDGPIRMAQSNLEAAPCSRDDSPHPTLTLSRSFRRSDWGPESSGVNQLSKFLTRSEYLETMDKSSKDVLYNLSLQGEESLRDSPIPSVAGEASPSSCTLHDYLRRFSTSTDPDVSTHDLAGAQAVLIWRGVRVRMGIHTGMPETDDVVANNVSGRMEYGGSLLELAQAVESAAAGGAVLLSEQAFKRVGSLQDALAAHAGLCSLKRASGPLTVNVMQVLNQVLLYRCATFTPVTPSLRIEHGFLQTAFGQGTICFMTSGDVRGLDKEARSKLIDKWQSTAREELRTHGGYILEATKNLVLTSFLRPSDAIRWALTTCSLLQPMNVEELSGQGTETGLILKCGLDHGPHRSFLNPVSGRIEHRGKVMNRSARICAFSKSGEVCCSQTTWLLAAKEMGYACGGKSTVTGKACLKRGKSWANLISSTTPSSLRSKASLPSPAHNMGTETMPNLLIQLADEDADSQLCTSSPRLVPMPDAPDPGRPSEMEEARPSEVAEGSNMEVPLGDREQYRKHSKSVMFMSGNSAIMACEDAEEMEVAPPAVQQRYSQPSLEAPQEMRKIVATDLGSRRLKGIQEEVVIVKLQFK